MTRPGIEPRSPGPLANTLTAGPMSWCNQYQSLNICPFQSVHSCLFISANSYISINISQFISFYLYLSIHFYLYIKAYLYLFISISLLSIFLSISISPYLSIATRQNYTREQAKLSRIKLKYRQEVITCSGLRLNSNLRRAMDNV